MDFQTQNSESQLCDGEIPSVLKKVDKWGAVENMGEPVGPTKFVPMKTPFSRQIIDAIIDQSESDQIEKKMNVLTVGWMLAENLKRGRQIGLIIDLSDHRCLYKQDVPAEVEYYEERLVAKKFPDEQSVLRVHHVANEFWQRCPNKYIAIHCAYGFNRTGFVLATYMIRILHMSVPQAVQTFKTARNPGIKHEKFINELYNRYSTPTCPIITTPNTNFTTHNTNFQLDVENSSFAPFEMVPIGGRNDVRDSNSEVDNESLGFEEKEVLTAFSSRYEFSKVCCGRDVQSPCSDSFNSNETISSSFRKRMWDIIWVKNYSTKDFSKRKIEVRVKEEKSGKKKGNFFRVFQRIGKFFGRQSA